MGAPPERAYVSSEMLRIYDCCVRLNAAKASLNYYQEESTGADAEVETFREQGKPVFFSLEELFTWLDDQGERHE